MKTRGSGIEIVLLWLVWRVCFGCDGVGKERHDQRVSIVWKVSKARAGARQLTLFKKVAEVSDLCP